LKPQVGTVQVGCSNVDGKAVVTIGPVNQTFIGSIDAAFFVGCQNPTECNPPLFGYSNPAPSCNTTSTGCAGSIDPFSTVLRQSSRDLQLSCPCSEARWVFSEQPDGSNSFLAAERIDGRCPATWQAVLGAVPGAVLPPVGLGKLKPHKLKHHKLLHKPRPGQLLG
jgi:hypothetical protein